MNLMMEMVFVSATTVFVMFLLFFMAMGRAISLKRCVDISSPVQIAALGGVFTFLASLAVARFWGYQLLEDYPTLLEKPWLFLLAIAKGGLLFAMIYLSQIIRKYSASAAEFRIFIAIGFVAFLNGFLGEALTGLQLLSAVVLSLMGIYFCLRGHIKDAPIHVKALFLLSILIFVCFGVMDQVFLSHVRWYSYGLMTGFVILMFGLCFGAKPRDLLLMFTNPKTLLAGLFWGFGEITILAAFITYIPVTVGFAALALAVPFVMLISALIWGEGRWQQQLLIGTLSYLAALPLMLS